MVKFFLVLYKYLSRNRQYLSVFIFVSMRDILSLLKGGYMMSVQEIIPQGHIVRDFSKANLDNALAIRDGKSVTLFYNPNDPTMLTF
jgi:hypothetical protein